MLTKQAICQALYKWINQRPGLEFANYGDWKSYRAELRQITKDRQHALQLLRAVELRDSITAENLIAAFQHAYSGRLSVREVIPAAVDGPPRAALSYCTGQYWPTEYRKAAASVLASVLWDRARSDMPAPNGKLTRTHGPFTSEHDNVEGMTPGDWLRRHFRREFGRGIQQRWFD